MSHPGAPGPNSGGEFSVTRRGYNPAQVEEHLRYLHAQLSMLAADRDAMSDQSQRLSDEIEAVRAEDEQLRARMRLLALHPLSAEGITERARLTLELATEEAEVVREGAQREARALVDRASVEHLRNERERHRLERERAEIAAEHAEASQALAAAHREADRIVAETSASRDSAERQLAASIAARWEEAESEAQRSEAENRTEAERLLARARQQAEHVISQARHVADGVSQSAADDRAEAAAVLESAREAAARTAEEARVEAERILEAARGAAREEIERAQQRAAALSDLDIDTFSRLAALRGHLDEYIAQAGESPAPPAVDTPPNQEPPAPGSPSNVAWPPVIDPVEPPAGSRGTASLPGFLPHEAQLSGPSGTAVSHVSSREQMQWTERGDEPPAPEPLRTENPAPADEVAGYALAPGEPEASVNASVPQRDSGSAHRFGGGRDLMWFLRYRNGVGR